MHVCMYVCICVYLSRITEGHYDACDIGIGSEDRIHCTLLGDVPLRVR